MKSFIIKRLDKHLELEEFNYKFKGFKYKTNSARLNDMHVREITIVNQELIDVLIKYSFNKNYKKILEMYLNAMEDESEGSEGNLIVVLDDIARLRSIIIKKYRTILSRKLEEQFLRRLKLLENELRTKIIDIRIMRENQKENELIMSEEKGRGR